MKVSVGDRGVRAPPAPSSPAPRRRPSGIRLGSVLGFDVDIDHSWFVVFFLVFWSLSRAVFPERAPDVGAGVHTAMGLVGTLLFFGSLLAHELSHAVASRAKGIPIEGITLFVFGGMARTAREPDSPRDELTIAVVGPLMSLLLAGAFQAVALGAGSAGLGAGVVAVASYLAVINFVLAVFNMLPGFPLDGGRVFRALAWEVTGDRARATRWASRGGRWIGTFLMVLGALQALTGAPLAGLWLAFIGWFLRTLAQMAYRQHVVHELLGDHRTEDLMTPDPDVRPAGESVKDLVEQHFLRARFGAYPVVDDGALVGLVTLEDVKSVPRDAWATTDVGAMMTPLSACGVVTPRAPIPALLEAMSDPRSRGRALVVDRGRLVGIVSASDVTRWLQRAELLMPQAGAGGVRWAGPRRPR